MKKKSQFILFSCLAISWLLLMWSVDAMTYTINGQRTSISIPKGNMNSSTIQRCTDCSEENFNPSNNDECEFIDDNIKCEHIYENSGIYEVTLKWNNQKFENLYLDNSNIGTISNTSNIWKITNLYIRNNTGLNLSNNIFSNNNVVNLHLEHNGLVTYNDTIYDSLRTLYLNYNLLTTIPENIRENRRNYEIVLSEYYRYNSDSDKTIHLDNNHIKFVWITGYNYNNYNDNHFERFGYDYENPNNPRYYYQIMQNWVEVENTTWTTTNEEISISTPLKPWDYTFRICIYWDDICNYNDYNIVHFSVDYDEEITITKPEVYEYDSLNNIEWERWRSWNYPKSLLSWYSYIITKWSQTIKEWFININDTNESCVHHDCINWIDIGNIIETELWWNNPNDEYWLTIYLIDKDWNIAQANNHNIYATSTFSINIISEPVTVNITQPASEVSSQIITFERNHIFPSSPYHTYDFQYYEYTVKKWSKTITWNNNTNNTWFKLEDLEDGVYTFEVIMHYADNSENKTATETKTFTMTASEAPHVSITSPTTSSISASNVITTGVKFSWICWATISHNCEYNLIDNSNPTSPIKEWVWDNWQFTQDLWNGNYTFTVNLYDSTHNLLTWDSVSFTISIPTTLTISSPISGSSISYATTTFIWEWFTPYTLNYYEYSVSWPSYSTGNNNTHDTWFQLHNLRDGEYTFTVQMHYNDWTDKFKTESSKFTVNASAWASLTITSPTNSKTYTWEYSKTVPIDFTWEWWGSDLISKYSYKLTNTLTNEEITWTVNKNIEWVYSIPRKDLPSGTYKFEVMMLDSENELIIPAETHIFNIIIPPHLNIITPVQNSNFSGQQNINFLRSWFSEFDDQCYYEWSLRKTKNNTTTTTTWKILNMVNMETTWLQLNLSNGIYDFTVKIMSGNSEIISKSHSFSILDPIDLQIYVSDWNTSVTTLKSKIWTFIWGGISEDFSWYYYYISGTNFKNELFYTWGTSSELTWSFTLTNLSTWKYRFWVNMLNSNSEIITWKYIDFNVSTPSSITITQPTSWSSINSSNVMFSRIWESDILRTWYSTDKREYRYELLKINNSWNTQILPRQITNANSFSHNFSEDGTYKFIVRLYSWDTIIANDNASFSISIPKHSSWGGGWGYSSKFHPTNNLSVSVTNDEPTTNEWIEVIVDINDKYTGKVDFTKMQYYSTKDEKRIDIPTTSKNYVSDYSDDAKLGYIKFNSSDNGKKELSEFMKFSQNGNYRIYVKDEDWYSDYVQFYIWKWNNTAKSNSSIKSNYKDSDSEVFIARSCKKYTITYSDSLNVYTSPNLNMSEYFMNKDYFKRYIDSKNRYQEGCPKNLWWISTSYYDKTNDNNRYTAPNGKVYFITWQEWNYYSNELNKELKSPTSFSTIQQLKYYIRDRNPLINMATLWPIN